MLKCHQASVFLLSLYIRILYKLHLCNTFSYWWNISCMDTYDSLQNESVGKIYVQNVKEGRRSLLQNNYESSDFNMRATLYHFLLEINRDASTRYIIYVYKEQQKNDLTPYSMKSTVNVDNFVTMDNSVIYWILQYHAITKSYVLQRFFLVLRGKHTLVFHPSLTDSS